MSENKGCSLSATFRTSNFLNLDRGFCLKMKQAVPFALFFIKNITVVKTEPEHDLAGCSALHRGHGTRIRIYTY